MMNAPVPDFPVEIVDEEAGDVLIFDNAELLAAFEASEDAEQGPGLDELGIRRRTLQLREQLAHILQEIDLVLGTAAA